MADLETARTILLAAYRDFNARRLDDVLALMQPDVVWPNGMEGGFVYGHQVVRDLEGKLLLDTTVRHGYRLRDGLIERMDIE